MNATARPHNPVREKLSAALFVMLLIVIGVASISQLRWTSPSGQMDSSFGGGYDLTAAAVMGLVVLLVGAAAWIVCPCRPRLNLLLAAEILFVAGLIVSTWFAADHRVALNYAAGFVVCLVLMHATFRLTDRPWKVRLALIALVALGTIFALKTWSRELYETDQTWTQYLETREQLWARQGKALDDPAVKLYEARLLSRDNGGFFFHGNLGGAYLAFLLMVSLAAVANRLRDQAGPYQKTWLVVQVLLSLLIASALVITYSKGAMMALGIALMVSMILLLFGRRLRRRVNLAALVALLIVLAGFAAVIGHGLARNTLPTLSMAFRWQYWTAGWHMFLDHPLTGVGPGNFGYHYMRYKLPEAEEEVLSPHNFIVQGFTEFGILGGLGIVLLPLAIFHTLARSAAVDSPPLPVLESQPPRAGPLMLIILAGIYIFAVAFNQTGLDNPLILLALHWPYILGFALSFTLSSLRFDELGDIDDRFGGRGKLVDPPVLVFLAGALVLFVAGNLVNFSFFEPSNQFLFFFTAGLALAATRPQTSLTTPKCDLAKSAGLAVLALLFLIYVVVPAARIETAVADAEDSPPARDPAFDQPYQRLVELTEQYPFDPHPPAKAAERLLRLAQPGVAPELLIAQAVKHFQQARSRAPQVYRFWRAEAQAWLLLAETRPTRADHAYTQAETLLDCALELAPRSRSLWVTAGLASYQHAVALEPAQPDRAARLALQAKERLTTALELNDALPPKSLRRFPPSQMRQIHSALASLDTFLSQTTQPAP